MTPNPSRGSAAVIVVGRDVIVGQALELLLRTDYDVVFAAEWAFEVSESLSGARLLILAPGLEPASRRSILASVRGKPASSRLPVLELVADLGTPQLVERHLVVPWPCRPEELKRQMEVALNDPEYEVEVDLLGDETPYTVQEKKDGA